MNRLIEKAQSLYARNEEVVLATILDANGADTRKVGSQMMIFSDGSSFGTVGGGDYEEKVIENALKIFSTKKDTRFVYAMNSSEDSLMDMICNSKVITFFQYFAGNDLKRMLNCIVRQNESRLYIFGAWSVGQAVAKLARFVGIPTTVIDENAEYCSKERFPTSYCRVIESFDKIPDFAINDNDMIVIVTRRHVGDSRCLEFALKTGASYIGMIGNENKRDTVFKDLVQNRQVSPELLQQVHCPLGIDIGAQTPEEVAVSIISEIVRMQANRNKNII